MLPASWLEYVAGLERDIKKTPTPTKRSLPRITRHQSPRMRRVSTQSINSVRAAYNPESDYNATPTKPNEWRGTRNLGGNCESRQTFAGKSTRTRG
jgi:hypothetical protein